MFGLGTRLLIGATLACSLAACAPRHQEPQGALRAYSNHLRKKNFNKAYAMMSEEFRAQHSREDFERLLRNNDAAVKETAARLRSREAGIEVFAEFRYGLGDTMRLVYEDGGWKITSNPAEFYSQASPREALRSFVRAYQAKRWDVMLRYVPRKYREQMTTKSVKAQFDGENRDEMRELMARVEEHLEEPIAVNGREARMPYAERYEVEFRREEDGWKISDLD